MSNIYDDKSPKIKPKAKKSSWTRGVRKIIVPIAIVITAIFTVILVFEQNTQNVGISINQSGGLTAGTVNNYGQISRHLNQGSIDNLNAKLPKDKTTTVAINAVLGDQEAFQFANEIKNYLESQGWKVNGVNQDAYNVPVTGQTIEESNEGIVITIGSNIR